MKRSIFAVAAGLLLWSCHEEAKVANVSDELAVEIEVVADSSNFLRAQVRAPQGTNARDLMEKLFTMDYLDAERKFVVGIAGFKVLPHEKKFWKLEVEGAASQVGVAEIVITRATRLRWVKADY